MELSVEQEVQYVLLEGQSSEEAPKNGVLMYLSHSISLDELVFRLEELPS